MSDATHFAWQSRRSVASQTRPGVEFSLARMSFGRRLELMQRVRDLSAHLEFFEAGRDSSNQMEAGLLGAEIDRLYVLWGIESVSGLTVDGEPATVDVL